MAARVRSGSDSETRRGGPIAIDKIVEHAFREAREYSSRGEPLYSVSVSLTIGCWSLDDFLAGPLASLSMHGSRCVRSPRSQAADAGR